MIVVRPETPEDRSAVFEIAEAAFDQRDEADLINQLRDGGFLTASSVALIEGKPVGHAALSTATIGGGSVLVLAPVAVSPPNQGEGVGTAVVNHVLETAADSAITVLGDPEYYGRFGFVPAEPFGVFPPFEVEPGAFQILRPERASQGTIHYAPPFGDL